MVNLVPKRNRVYRLPLLPNWVSVKKPAAVPVDVALVLWGCRRYHPGMPTRAITTSLKTVPKPLHSDEELAAIATAVRACQVKAVESIIEMGRLFCDAQQLLSHHHHGVFSKWLDSECELSPTTARRAMNVFKQFGKESRAKVAQLEISALYALATPTCPPKARAAAMKLADRGCVVSHKVASQLVAKHKPVKTKEPITDLELAHLIRIAIWNIYQSAPDELKQIVIPKFRDFANEMERTGTLDW